MQDLQKDIRAIIDKAQSPALLCSWGKDSSLLLYHARRVKPDIAIYYFGEDLPSLAAELVVKDDVAVRTFAPTRSFISREHLIDEYRFNGFPVPMLSAVTTSDGCKHGHLKSTVADFYFPHDVVFWGYRHADSHPLLPGVRFDREIELGHTKFVAPLYDLTADQVLNALDALGLEYEEDLPEVICDHCMQTLISNATLAGFQERQISH